MDVVNLASQILFFIGVLAFSTGSVIWIKKQRREMLIRRQRKADPRGRLRQEEILTSKQKALVYKGQIALQSGQFYQAANLFLEAGQLRRALDVFFLNKRLWEGIQLMLMFGAVERAAQICQQMQQIDMAATLFFFNNSWKAILDLPFLNRRILGLQWFAAGQLSDVFKRVQIAKQLQRYDWILRWEPNEFPFSDVTVDDFCEILTVQVIRDKWFYRRKISPSQMNVWVDWLFSIPKHKEYVLVFLVQPEDWPVWLAARSSAHQEALKGLLQNEEFRQALSTITQQVFPRRQWKFSEEMENLIS